jgi:PTH1 family peptidyl-tRNA hydrolase
LPRERPTPRAPTAPFQCENWPLRRIRIAEKLSECPDSELSEARPTPCKAPHARPRAAQVGFMAIDAPAAAEGVALTTTQLRASVGKGVIAGKQVLLVKPQTFMNSSGESVVPLLKFYKVPPSRLLVIYDDLDIDVAELRLRTKGGHGGHNGMRSIVTCLSGSQDFPRLRIGIGRPNGQRSVADHVLTTFDKRENEEVQARARIA